MVVNVNCPGPRIAWTGSTWPGGWPSVPLLLQVKKPGQAYRSPYPMGVNIAFHMLKRGHAWLWDTVDLHILCAGQSEPQVATSFCWGQLSFRRAEGLCLCGMESMPIHYMVGHAGVQRYQDMLFMGQRRAMPCHMAGAADPSTAGARGNLPLLPGKTSA